MSQAGRGLAARLARWSAWMSLSAGGLLLVTSPAHAPWAVLPGLALALGPLIRAWRGAGGTSLRSSVAWGFAAVVLGVVVELLALSEPAASGRPWTGHAAYLCTLSTLAGLISVLNARTPGSGAWALLMGLLVLVFLIPWLEGPGLVRAVRGLGRLRLDHPWTFFYGLLVLAGVTNYLPTRFGLAAAWLGLGFGLEYLGLTQTGRSPEGRAAVWAAVPWTLAGAVATAELRARAESSTSGRLDRVWLWFRDSWGVVWALRVLERFNRSAESQRWPIRLTWHGVSAIGGGPAGEVPAGATALLSGLLRRFATPERIERAVGPPTTSLAKGAGLTDDA